MLSDPDADITTSPPDSTIVTLNPEGVLCVGVGVCVNVGVGVLVFVGVTVLVGVTVFVGVSGSSKVASIASMSWFPKICLSSTPVKENASGLQL